MHLTRYLVSVEHVHVAGELERTMNSNHGAPKWGACPAKWPKQDSSDRPPRGGSPKARRATCQIKLLSPPTNTGHLRTLARPLAAASRENHAEVQALSYRKKLFCYAFREPKGPFGQRPLNPPKPPFGACASKERSCKRLPGATMPRRPRQRMASSK